MLDSHFTLSDFWCTYMLYMFHVLPASYLRVSYIICMFLLYTCSPHIYEQIHSWIESFMSILSVMCALWPREHIYLSLTMYINIYIRYVFIWISLKCSFFSLLVHYIRVHCTLHHTADYVQLYILNTCDGLAHTNRYDEKKFEIKN